MADDVPLAFYLPAGLFLKPEARVWIEVKLPEIKDSGKSISNWEVMEKIKALSMPVEFISLRVSNYSRELIQFEGELDSVRNVRKIVLLLHGKSMKLSGFSELLKLKAKQVASPQPTKAEWEEHFQSRGVSSFDDGRPGERADTLKISGLPVKWFTSRTSSGRPCHKVLIQAFQKFGTVSQVGIYDPTAAAALGRKEEKFSSFGPGSRQFYFEAYIQYEKYAGFNNAMGALKGMSLLRLEEGGKEAVVRIAVDFDKTAFLSERNVRKRRRAEERRREEMEEKRRLEEEKKREEERRRQEEERRREEEAAKRRAEREERRRKKRKQRVAVVTELKNVAVQRRGEAQRLLRTILAGAAEEKYQQEEAEKRARQEREQREEAEQRRRERVAEEGVLRDKLIRNVHQLERRRKEVQRELVLRNISESGSSSRDRRRRSPREHGHGASGVSSAVVAPRHHRH